MTRSMLYAVALLAGSVACGAQSGRPITSLPRAPGDTSVSQPTQQLPPSPSTDSSATPALDIAPVPPAPTAEAPAETYTPSGATTIPSMGTDVLAPKPTAASAPATDAPAASPSGAPVKLAPAPPIYAQPGQPTTTTPAAPASSAPAPLITPYPVSETPAAAPAVTPDMGPPPLQGGLLTAETPNAPEPAKINRKPHFGPGSAIAIQIKGGFAGAGIDIATPLAQRVNLRVGASFFNFNGSYNVDGMDIDGEAKFRSVTAQVDIFPFGGGFRISPGFTVFNGNSLNANLLVPAGQEFDLGDDSFTSDPSNPVAGTASMTFGSKVAPSITIGWGNMIPRSNRHISFPFEIGIQYIKDPQFHLDLHGVACGSNASGTGCEQIASDPQDQQDVLNEENQINNDIHPLRFYPIVSFGVAYAFHIGKH